MLPVTNNDQWKSPAENPAGATATEGSPAWRHSEDVTSPYLTVVGEVERIAALEHVAPVAGALLRICLTWMWQGIRRQLVRVRRSNVLARDTGR